MPKPLNQEFSMSRFFKFRRGDRCITQNCEAGFINNDIHVVVVDIDPARVNARGQSTPYRIERVDGAHFPQSTGTDTGKLQWYRFPALYCAEQKLRRWEATREVVLQISAATARPAAMALDMLVSERMADGLPVDLGVITGLREQVENVLEAALAGVVVDDMPDGWSAEEALEQVALRVAMDMLLGAPRNE
jgi:hypothetical protein